MPRIQDTPVRPNVWIHALGFAAIPFCLSIILLSTNRYSKIAMPNAADEFIWLAFSGAASLSNWILLVVGTPIGGLVGVAVYSMRKRRLSR